MKTILTRIVVITALCSVSQRVATQGFNCRERSNHMRQDGGLCFEIPPWQHQPVQLEEHVKTLRDRFTSTLENATDTRRTRNNHLALANSEITRYMDTVLAPFLDTYHRNIQSAYQQLTNKILRRIKEEINAAVRKKSKIFKDLTTLADELDVPEMCDEERRQARTLASNHVAQIYACTEGARASIAKMGRYAEEMIAITRTHMQHKLGKSVRTLEISSKTARSFNKSTIIDTLKDLSRAAVALGYELDLSLTNARRHNEQSCEKLTNCCTKAKKKTEEDVTNLRDQIYQCVYA